MSSRSQLCINNDVNGYNTTNNNLREDIDTACRIRTAPWVRERVANGNPEHGDVICEFFDPNPPVGSGIFNLEDLRTMGRQKGFCPYYYARAALREASVVVFSYQYVLNGDIFKAISKDAIGANAICVFDEAHNMDSVCIESLTVRLGRTTLEDARSALDTLNERLAHVQATDQDRLQREYQRLLRGLRNEGIEFEEEARDEQEEDRGGAEAVVVAAGNAVNGAGAGAAAAADVVAEVVAVPGAIRKGVHFVHLMVRLVDYLILQLSEVAGNQAVRVERPVTFLRRCNEAIVLPPVKTLQFVSTRLASLLRTLQMAPSAPLQALRNVASLITILSQENQPGRNSFTFISYPRALVPLAAIRMGWEDGMLQLACLDASMAMRHTLQHFPTVLITSATLSPLHMFPKILGMQASMMEELPMSNSRRCILPLVVCRGSDQSLLNTKYKNRTDAAMHRNYAALLCDLAQCVPDGMIVFFPSYGYMEQCVQAWHQSGLLQALLQHKLVFIETRNSRETALALRNFQAACDSGRGAVLLSVARGKVSEGVDFGHHHGRCVVVIGVPYQYTKAAALQQRLAFMQENQQINQTEYLNFDAIRQAAQCVGRVIRSKSDYSVMVFADSRYGVPSRQGKLPEWIKRCVSQDYNVSVVVVVDAKFFLFLLNLVCFFFLFFSF